MRIKYNILWIENEAEWLEQALEFVRDVLDENGFLLRENLLKSEAEISTLLEHDPNLEKYDLILVDFQLNKGDQGNKIIENIRNHKVYTEIIFYSQDIQGIRSLMNQNFIDGIYLANRDGEDFRDKFFKVFISTVKKAQDISAIRGLVLSEASDLDNKVHRLISAFLQKYPGHEKELRDYIFKSLINDFPKQAVKTVEKLSQLPSEELIDDRYFDAYKKMRVLGQILEILKNDELVDKDTFIKRYKAEIIEIRNELAHCIELEVDNKIVLQTTSAGKSFDDETCKEIRKNIRQHVQFLEAIENAL